MKIRMLRMSIMKEQSNCLRRHQVSYFDFFLRIQGNRINYYFILGAVKLVVRYTPKVLDEMEARFEKQRIGRRNIK